VERAIGRSAAGLCLLGALSLALLLLGPAASAHAETWGAISGEVKDASSHDPLQGIGVCAISTNFELLSEEEEEHSIGCATTAAGGEYTISELRPESYFVEFFAPLEGKLNYMTQFYDDELLPSEAAHVSVTAGGTTLGIDAELSPGAEIAGSMTDAETGAPIGGAACALRTNVQGALEAVSCALSETNGEYTIRGLPSGGYKLWFIAKGFEAQYYNDKSSVAAAELVPVIAPELTQGIDIALKPGSPTSSPGSTPAQATPTSKLPGGLTTPSSAAPDAALSLTGRRIAVVRDGYALVKLGCAGTASCRVKLTLKVTMTVKVKGRRTRRTVTIGKSAVLSLAPGKKETEKIELDATGRGLLSAGHGHLEVDLALATPGRKQDDSAVLIEQRARGEK
jgi:Carboxypeptidase regulatory-like domain